MDLFCRIAAVLFMSLLSKGDTHQHFFRTMPIIDDKRPNIDMKLEGFCLPSAIFWNNIIPHQIVRSKFCGETREIGLERQRWIERDQWSRAFTRRRRVMRDVQTGGQ